MTKIQIPDELEKQMRKQADKLHISMDEYMKDFFEFFLDYLEDQEDYLIACERMERLEKGLEKTIPFEEVLKKLGLDKPEQS